MKTPHRPSLADAVARYNADRATEVNLPRPGTGTCPVCKHNDCFGRLKGETTKWACWSTAHPPDAGKPSSRYVWGDLLDLDLLLAEITPTPVARARWLRDRSYLPDGQTSAQPAPPPSRPTPAANSPDAAAAVPQLLDVLFGIAKRNDPAALATLPLPLQIIVEEAIERAALASENGGDFDGFLARSIRGSLGQI